MVRLGYTYPETEFVVMAPTYGHNGANYDCDNVLMVPIREQMFKQKSLVEYSG